LLESFVVIWIQTFAKHLSKIVSFYISWNWSSCSCSW